MCHFQCGVYMARWQQNYTVPGQLKSGLHHGLQYVGLNIVIFYIFMIFMAGQLVRRCSLHG